MLQSRTIILANCNRTVFLFATQLKYHISNAVEFQVLPILQRAPASEQKTGPVETSRNFGDTPQAILVQPLHQKQTWDLCWLPNLWARLVRVHCSQGWWFSVDPLPLICYQQPLWTYGGWPLYCICLCKLQVPLMLTNCCHFVFYGLLSF